MVSSVATATADAAKALEPRMSLSESLRQIHHDETPIFARLAEELGIDLAGFRPLDGAVA